MKRWLTAIGILACMSALDNSAVGQTCDPNEVLCGTLCVEPLEGFYFCDAGRGIDPVHMSAVAGTGEQSGAAAADFDNDGYVDLYIPQAAGTPDLLYRYDSGLQQFVNVAALDRTARIISGVTKHYALTDGFGKTFVLDCSPAWPGEAMSKLRPWAIVSSLVYARRSMPVLRTSLRA